VPGGIRTPNLLIRSQKLYPVELQALRNFRFSISDLRFEGKTNRQSAIANFKLIWGGRRDSNPQQPEPQSGALPLSYGHHNSSETESRIPIPLCKQRARLFPSAPLIVGAGGSEISPQPVGYGAAASCNAMRGGLARRRMFFPRSNDARRHATG
jgi:hypothetical protein